MDLKPEIIERIKLLDEKYQATGQDLLSYLDGLLYADYLTYWDYIHLDTLLSLQTPKTNIPDERIFIMYHQITELYFKLCMQEFGLLYDEEKPNGAFVLERLRRIGRVRSLITENQRRFCTKHLSRGCGRRRTLSGATDRKSVV